MDYIEYNCIITLTPPKSWLLWFDNFTLNNENTAIRIKHLKNIEKYYNEKIPSTNPHKNYYIAIFNKNRWILIKDNKLELKISSKDEIPSLLNSLNLNKTYTAYYPILTLYSFDFDIHILLTIISESENIKILSSKKNSYSEESIIMNNIKIKVYNSKLDYRGDEINIFQNSVIELEEIYNAYSPPLIKIYKYLDNPIPDPAKNLKSIAYKTWYNAKRQNQREWPLLTKNINNNIKSIAKNIVEFPKNSGFFYYHPIYYVGLAMRYDINYEKFIPKLYKTNHSLIKGKILYNYINNILPDEKILTNTPKEIKTNYQNYNLLDKDGNSLHKFNPDWPSLPYNYTQILIDYKKLGRLIKGPIQDLTHIGIVDPDADDIITYPHDIEDYKTKGLETHRIMSFKLLPNTKLRILYI